MLKVLWNGRSGLYSNQNRLDMISNNLSNVDTNGYKRVDVNFEDIVYNKMDRLGLPVTSSERDKLIQGSGSKGESIVRDTKQGLLQETGKESDIAIIGPGYFRLKDAEGNYFYSRDGAFSIDKDGNFVHTSGYLLDIDGYDAKNLNRPISIDEKGNLYSGDKIIGKINLYDFTDKDNMVSLSQNLFQSTEEPKPVYGILKQGFVEKSNVDISKELTDMLVTQRAFELNSQSIKSADEMWQIANNLRSK